MKEDIYEVLNKNPKRIRTVSSPDITYEMALIAVLSDPSEYKYVPWRFKRSAKHNFLLEKVALRKLSYPGSDEIIENPMSILMMADKSEVIKHLNIAVKLKPGVIAGLLKMNMIDSSDLTDEIFYSSMGSEFREGQEYQTRSWTILNLFPNKFKTAEYILNIDNTRYFKAELCLYLSKEEKLKAYPGIFGLPTKRTRENTILDNFITGRYPITDRSELLKLYKCAVKTNGYELIHIPCKHKDKILCGLAMTSNARAIDIVCETHGRFTRLPENKEERDLNVFMILAYLLTDNRTRTMEEDTAEWDIVNEGLSILEEEWGSWGSIDANYRNWKKRSLDLENEFFATGR